MHLSMDLRVLMSSENLRSKNVEKTKSSALSLIYWPGIENKVAKCLICQKFRNANTKDPLISHDILYLIIIFKR